MDGFVFALPLSLLPQLKVTSEATVSDNLAAAAELQPSKPLQAFARQDAGCKDKRLGPAEKVSTRQKMLAVNHSMSQALQMKFADTCPPVLLRAAGPNEVRCYTDVGGRKEAYLWNVSTKESVWQCSRLFAPVIRVTTMHDEGDAGYALQLAQAGLAILPMRDTQHKIHREEMLSLSDVRAVDIAVKEVMLVTKFDRAPWRTSHFGRRLREAEDYIHHVPPDHPLVQTVSLGIISDQGLAPGSSLQDVHAQLAKFAAKGGDRTRGDHKLSRWSEFLRTFAKLKREWHVRLFFFLLAYVLEGVNPWNELCRSLEVEGKDKDVSLAPKVLRVTLTALPVLQGTAKFRFWSCVVRNFFGQCVKYCLVCLENHGLYARGIFF